MIDTWIIVGFWSIIIIVAEVLKWVASYHLFKLIPWVKGG